MSEDPRFAALYEALAGGPEKREAARRELWRTVPSSVRAVLVMAAGMPGSLSDLPLDELTDGQRARLIDAIERVTQGLMQARRALVGPPIRKPGAGGTAR